MSLLNKKKSGNLIGMIAKSVFFVIICLNLPFVLKAQYHKEPELIGLSGILLSADSLKAIPEAQIYSKDNFLGTYSDLTGHFMIAVVWGDSLLFSSMGYANKVVPVTDSILSLKQPIHFYMSLDTVLIHEVVIHAFWSYAIFKQMIIDMKPAPWNFDISKDLEKNPLLYKEPVQAFTIEGPVQALYNLLNRRAVFQRRLIRNRKIYNRNMLKLGKPQDTIPAIPDYMRAKQH